MKSVYDEHHEFYIDFVDRVAQTAPYRASIDALLLALGDLEGKRVCDLACGEGFLSRILAARGARVRGFDGSARLIECARRRSDRSIRFEVNDAQRLQDVPNAAFDIVVCHLAAMDIPDIVAMFDTVHRVLVPGGVFALTILHPCFETPFSGDETIAETDSNGKFVACRVMHYKEEGHWNSGGTGVRGTVGAYHRMLSTYVNQLIASRFQVTKMLEPMLANGDYEDFADQWGMQIPRRLSILAVAL